MNRRSFVSKLAGIGLFTILPGAGRIWKAEKQSRLSYSVLRSAYDTMRMYDAQARAHRQLMEAIDANYFEFIPTFQDFPREHDRKLSICRDNLGDVTDNRPIWLPNNATQSRKV